MAASWFEKNGSPYEAIFHASIIEDLEWVERLIQQNYMEIFQRGYSSYLRFWTGELSRDLIFTRPRLCIYEAMSRSWLGRLTEAELFIEKAEEHIREAGKTSPDVKAMKGHVSYIKARLTAMKGDYDKAIALCHTAIKYTPDNDSALHGGIGVMLGYALFLKGDFDSAIQTLNQTITSGKLVGAINTTIGAYCVLARLIAIQGKLNQAWSIYQEAAIFLDGTPGQHQGSMSIVDVGMAEILYEHGDLELAQSHVMRGLEYIHLWSKADDMALAYALLTRIKTARHDFLEAEEAAKKGRKIVETRGVFPECRVMILSAELRLAMAREDKPTIHQLGHQIQDFIHENELIRFESELALIWVARIRSWQKQPLESMELAKRIETSAYEWGRIDRLIQAKLIQALSKEQNGFFDQSLDDLTRCMEWSESGGFARIILDEGRPILNLLEKLNLKKRKPHLQLTLSKLFSLSRHNEASGSTHTAEQEIADGLIESLSARELEVLQLIARGDTNKDIAKALFVAPGTIKAHTASIYRKLDVANRTEAVARARQLSILS